MTATALRPRAAERAAPVRRRSGETLVFAGAIAVALVHALDDAFLHRGPGVALGQHVFGMLVSLLLAVGAVWAFPRVRPLARAAVALFFGSAAVVNGAMHVKHVGVSGVGGADVTGLLALGAGLVMVGLALAVLWRHRGEAGYSTRRRWTNRILAVPFALLAIAYTAVPVGIAITETHKWRSEIGAPPDASYREVAFDASDGVRITGWYRPTRNGATLLVLHGGGGDRTGALRHAKMLVRHGYGVLLWDARGRGASEGVQNSWGWGWEKDVAGAMAFLKARPEVDPERIGGLGLSTGADVLVNAAGERHDLKAVVGDGTALGRFEDQRHMGNPGMTPFFAVDFAAVRLFSGSRPGAIIEESVKKITSPVLLVAAGPLEKPFGEAYDRAAGDRPLDVWYLPDAGHTAAIRDAAPEYEQRVTAFFDDALLGVR